MTTNVAEGRTTTMRELESRFKLENYLSLVNEKHVTLRRSISNCGECSSGNRRVLRALRTLSRTLYALLATMTTGRCLRIGYSECRTERFEVWRQLVHHRQRVEASQCCKLCCSREWVTIWQRLGKSGMRGSIRWTSARNSRRQSWMMM